MVDWTVFNDEVVKFADDLRLKACVLHRKEFLAGEGEMAANTRFLGFLDSIDDWESGMILARQEGMDIAEHIEEMLREL